MKYELTARRLNQVMEDRQISAAYLSQISGVSEGSISQYRKGIHQPSNVTSSKLGKCLNVNPLWLMGFDVPSIRDDEPECYENLEHGSSDLSELLSPDELTLLTAYRNYNGDSKLELFNMLVNIIQVITKDTFKIKPLRRFVEYVSKYQKSDDTSEDCDTLMDVMTIKNLGMIDRDNEIRNILLKHRSDVRQPIKANHPLYDRAIKKEVKKHEA